MTNTRHPRREAPRAATLTEFEDQLGPEFLAGQARETIRHVSEFLDDLMVRERITPVFIREAPRKYRLLCRANKVTFDADKQSRRDMLAIRKLCCGSRIKAARDAALDTERLLVLQDPVSAASAALLATQHALEAAGALLGLEDDRKPARERAAATNARKEQASKGGLRRHAKTTDGKLKIRTLFAKGTKLSRNAFAKKHHAEFGLSLTTARRALIGEPLPPRK